ncbi:MAG TPA: polysaccharide biosynthesis protein [Candidatus Angelobacter sp.]|nr:polysaccharide biosynthesis protein [Candidatus Angelobacter sp.]
MTLASQTAARCVSPVSAKTKAIDWSAFLNRPLFTAAGTDDATTAGKTVLVTGAGGSIGSILAERLMGGVASHLLLLDSSEQNLFALYQKYQERHVTLPKTEFFHADILDEKALQDVISSYQPQIVFHAAAMKHVPQLEHDPFVALKNNLIGTLRLLEALDQCPLECFVNVSTDKAVNPSSILGASKRITELLLLAMQPEHARCLSLRLGNVLGSAGSVVPLFLQSLEEHKPLQITDPFASRYFITLEETAAFLLESLELPESSVLLPELGTPLAIVDLANFLLSEFGEGKHTPQPSFIGLRDGEKQNEQLIYSYEYLEATSVTQLYKVCGSGISDRETFIRKMADLLDLVRARCTKGLVEALTAIVPEYVPSPTFLRHAA